MQTHFVLGLILAVAIVHVYVYNIISDYIIISVGRTL